MLKMNFIFKIFIIFLSISLNAQQRRSADYYAQIPEKIENEQEIRIYKDFSLTNGGKIFRIYLHVFCIEVIKHARRKRR